MSLERNAQYPYYDWSLHLLYAHQPAWADALMFSLTKTIEMKISRSRVNRCKSLYSSFLTPISHPCLLPTLLNDKNGTSVSSNFINFLTIVPFYILHFGCNIEQKCVIRKKYKKTIYKINYRWIDIGRVDVKTRTPKLDQFWCVRNRAKPSSRYNYKWATHHHVNDVHRMTFAPGLVVFFSSLSVRGGGDTLTTTSPILHISLFLVLICRLVPVPVAVVGSACRFS